eukprot:Em0009g546a
MDDNQCLQVFFLIDEAEQAGKGVVSLVHAFFHLHGLGERRVALQADNCVGQNKNTTMMWYLAWRVITGQHDTIQLNFMLPGHTKFRPDSYFGLFKNGLSLTRSLYLYERVREYVHDPQKRDKVCPKPPPGTGPDSGNASSLPESDQPGPSTAIPHSPTVEGHESAEDTYSEVQDGEDGCVSGRRKRRPRSELILAYQCTVCGKRYASGPALSLHKKNTHKQPTVPCDEHGDATKVDN